MKYARMAIEAESPEEFGYDRIRNNLSESAVADRRLGELGVDLSALANLTLHYGDHRGEPALRELVAAQAGSEALTPDDVLVCAGAAGALFIVSTTLLEKGSHLVVVRPNYATNIETPRAIGAEISFVDLAFESGFRIDVDAIEKALRPDTVLISVTCPHNPTGTMMAWHELQALDAIAARHGCHVLVDETYRDLAHTTPYPSAASLGERFIAVSSLSKAYGVPGLRVGWLATRDAALYERFLAAKEQIGICGSVLDEHVAVAVLRDRQAWLAGSNARYLRHLDIVREWVRGEPLIEWVEPTGGVVCFPRLSTPDEIDIERFHRALLHEHGTCVGPGHWFGMPKHHLRIGFAWPTEAQLRNGLAAISACLRESRRAG